MGYPDHWLLSFGGHQGEVNEIWACGIRVGVIEDSGLPDDVDEESYITDQAIPALSTWFANPLSHIHAAARLQWIKFNRIAPDGRYADPTTVHERGVNYSGGGGSSFAHPLQVAVVLSWRTDARIRPPGAFGRIYCPRPAVPVSPEGDIDGSMRVDIADSAAEMLNTLDTAIGTPPFDSQFRPCIVSAVGAGTMEQIDTVVVDSSLDVQRRRSNRQTKEVTSSPVLY